MPRCTNRQFDPCGRSAISTIENTTSACRRTNAAVQLPVVLRLPLASPALVNSKYKVTAACIHERGSLC